MRKKSSNGDSVLLTRDVVDLISEETGFTKEHIRTVLQCLAGIMRNAVLAGITVKISNLGILSSYMLPERRTSKNIVGGSRETVIIPPAKRVLFSVSRYIRKPTDTRDELDIFMDEEY